MKTENRPRTYHFIDMENLVGKPHCTEAEVETAFRQYLDCADVRETDPVIVATSHHNQCAIAFGVRSARDARILPARSGKNGADLALIEEINNYIFRPGLDNVSLGSGDGIFAFSMSRLKREGVNTRVVGNEDSVAHELWKASNSVSLIRNINANIARKDAA